MPDLDEVLLRILDGLLHCVRNLRRLAETIAYMTVSVADDNERGEAGDTTALNGLGYTVEHNEFVFKLILVGIQHFCHVILLKFSIKIAFDRCTNRNQNSSPPSRAPSASSDTRP